MKFSARVVVPVVAQAGITVVITGLLIADFSRRGTGAAGEGPLDWMGGPSALLVLLLVSSGALLALAYKRWNRLHTQLHLLPAQVRVLGQGQPLPPRLSLDPPEEIRHVVKSLKDFAVVASEYRSAKADLEKIALTDPLTGLPNRRGLLDFLKKVVGSRRGWINPQTVGVMHVDLDHFKTINDTLGHDAGDHVLREATKRMEATVRETDLIARLGGDEFALVLPGIEDEAILCRLATRLIEKFEPPIVYGDELCRVGVSVGVVLGHDHDQDSSPMLLLNHADIALTQAKAAGRGRMAVFDPSMASAEAAKTDLAAEIREGLLGDEFNPFFQPVMNMSTNALSGLSVHPRWFHPERGMQVLSDFQKPAESHNMIEEIGMQVLEKACDSILDWRRSGIDTGLIFLCLSRAQLLAPGVVDKVTWIIDDSGIPPEAFAIQISEEDCQGRSVEIIFENLQRLREHGLKVVLDDFGVSTASLTNIATLQCAQLVCNAATVDAYEMASECGPDLLAGLLAAIDAMQIPVTVKHVDSEKQVRTLRNKGFQFQQGAAVAPAMDRDGATAWLRANQAASARLAAG